MAVLLPGARSGDRSDVRARVQLARKPGSADRGAEGSLAVSGGAGGVHLTGTCASIARAMEGGMELQALGYIGIRTPKLDDWATYATRFLDAIRVV